MMTQLRLMENIALDDSTNMSDSPVFALQERSVPKVYRPVADQIVQ